MTVELTRKEFLMLCTFISDTAERIAKSVDNSYTTDEQKRTAQREVEFSNHILDVLTRDSDGDA